MTIRGWWLAALGCSLAGVGSAGPCGSSLQCIEYERRRQALVIEERERSFEGALVLSPDELKAGHALASLVSSSGYDPSLQYHAQQQQVESSSLFKALQSMPKGAVLHLHALGSINLAVQALTRGDCWVAYGSFITQGLDLFFGDTPPPPAANASAWQLCTSQNNTFEARVRAAMLFTSPPPTVAKNDMWELFDATIRLATLPLLYAPHWQAVRCDALQQWGDDGVRHVELRVNFEGHYTVPNGTAVPFHTLLDAYRSAVQECSSSGVASIAFIMALRRDSTQEQMQDALDATLELLVRYGPEVILGFDIDSEEDRFHTLAYYSEAFLQANLTYFFHAGETVFNEGNFSNIFSALALNTSRIGHGFSLRDMPAMQAVVRERGVGIELCPLSNQILRLVADLEDHPGFGLAANGLAVSFSSDDPIIYGYAAVTPDWLAATAAWNLSLAFLKQAANESLRTSRGPAGQLASVQQWEQDWQAWIQWMLQTFVKI